MTTWDDKPNDYEHALAEIERLHAERDLALILKAKISEQIYLAVQTLDGSSDILSIIGSYGDTLDDQDVLDALVLYNSTGKALIDYDRQKM